MKKLLLSLVVLATIFSCGKKNTVDGANAYTVSNTYSGMSTDSRFTSLASIVTNNQFNNSGWNYYSEFNFYDMVNTCVTKDGWFGIDYQSCSTTKSNKSTVIFGNLDQARIDAKKAEMVAILNKTVQIGYSGYVYTVRTTDNLTYSFDVRFPIVANPVYRLDNSSNKANGLGDYRY